MAMKLKDAKVNLQGKTKISEFGYPGLSIVSVTYSQLQNSISIPSYARANDLAIIVDNLSSGGTYSEPTGGPDGSWTSIGSSSVASFGNVSYVYRKVLTTSDVNSSVTGYSKASAINNTKMLILLRPTITINNVFVNDFIGNATNGNVGSQTITAPSVGATFVFIFWSKAGLAEGSTNPQNIDYPSQTVSSSGLQSTTLVDYYGYTQAVLRIGAYSQKDAFIDSVQASMGASGGGIGAKILQTFRLRVE